MDQHTFQHTLQELRELLEDDLITQSDYEQQKTDVLMHLRETFAVKQRAHKEALQILRAAHAAKHLTDADYEREKKWFLQAMLPSTSRSDSANPPPPSAGHPLPPPSPSTPSAHAHHAAPPHSHGADVWATGGASPPPFQPHQTPQPTPPQASTDAQDPRDPLVGRVLSERFRIERLAGVGGMGRVYQCYDLHKESHYALKVLPPYFAQDEALRQRMLQEIRINERMNHKGIVRTYDLFHQPDVGAFFTMEWLEGQTLEQLLSEARQRKQKPALPLPQIATLFEHIGDALEHAHQHEIVHRDLKPANLMILPEHRIKIMDFGIAKIVDARITQHTGMTGTVYYMSPEQARGETDVTRKSDVYSLAVVLYETLTLMTPMGRVTPPSRLCTDLPQEADEILLRALENLPEDRYPTVAAFLREILPWMRQTTPPRKNESPAPTPHKNESPAPTPHKNEPPAQNPREEKRLVEEERLVEEKRLLNEQRLIDEKRRIDDLYEEVFRESVSKKAVREQLNQNFPLLRKAAPNDLRALALLGECYAEGCGVEKDDVRAAVCFRKAAEQGNTLAQGSFAVMLMFGRGVEKDAVRSVFWCNKAANMGLPSAQFLLGVMYMRGYGVAWDDLTAFFWFNKAAEQDHADAHYMLSTMCKEGRSVPTDHAKAAVLLYKAAELGSTLAQNNLGDMHKKGRGVIQDDAKSAFWYAKSAENDDPDAQYNLGLAYAEGRGLPQDNEKAVYWYTKAAEQGHPAAQNNLGNMYKKGRGIQKSDAKSVFWYTKAAEQGLVSAQNNLGLMYEKGLGVLQDNEKAVYWYTKAAEQGLPAAKEALQRLGVRLGFWDRFF